jgi:tight adherence protein B
MSRRRPVAALAAALVTAFTLGLPAEAASEGVSIREVETEKFPTVEVTISLDQPESIEREDVQVDEGGVPVEGFSMHALESSGRSVEVVLALDVSGSMEGEPLAAAVAAARRFMQTVKPGVDVGLIAFSDRARVLQGLTDDRDRLLHALQGVRAAGETALFDAVSEAVSMFSADAQRNLILLSDGGDTASRMSRGKAISSAVDAGVSVFSIGWRTPDTDIASLHSLSQRTDGRYASAGSADVEAIYAGLAEELSNQYLISYRSRSAAGTEQSLTISGSWGSDTTLVLFPKVARPRPDAPPPAPQPYRPPLLRGALGMAVSVGMVFIAVAVLLVAVLDLPARRRRRRLLERRIKAPKGQGGASEEGQPTSWIPASVASAAERMAESAGFAKRLDGRLERAGASLRPGEFVAGTAMATLVLGLAGGLIFRSFLGGFLFALLGTLVPIVALGIAMRRRLNRLHGQVVDVLMIIASSLRAGHSFLQAIDMVSKEISEPAAGEFSRAVSEIRLGRPVQEALNSMAERMGSEDFDWAMMAVNIQREVGGNLAEVLDTVGETLRDRETVRRQVKVLAAEGKLSARILTVLPFAIGLYIAKINPGYLNLLFTTQLGLVMLIGASALMLLGIFIMRRMVRIDV